MNKEDLKYELPDFINGKNNDEKIKKEIEILLRTDNEFSKYYEKLRSATAFLNNTEIDPPSDAYFTNLPARINERISDSVTAKRSIRLKDILKYLVPVIPVIILIAFVFLNSGNDSSEQAEIAHIIEKPLTITDNTGEIIIPAENNTDEPGIVNDSQVKVRTFTARKRNTFTGSQLIIDKKGTQPLPEQPEESFIEEDLLDDGLSLTDYDLILDTDDNYSVEDEFEELSPERQQEVLTNLSRADI